jgi:hypothetical protein
MISSVETAMIRAMLIAKFAGRFITALPKETDLRCKHSSAIAAMVQWSGENLQTSGRSAGLLTIHTAWRPRLCRVHSNALIPRLPNDGGQVLGENFFISAIAHALVTYRNKERT